MTKYNHQEVESKWRAKWEQSKLYKTPDITEGGKKKYILEAFPYPSGDGLHVGHALPSTAGDISARYLTLNGYNVLHPIGFDAFGLPTENFAKKKGLHPQIVTDNSIANFKAQLQRLGANYDWDREINTTKPEYYKWTQWFFQLLYKRGLAYKKEALVNWDPVDQTVLANEQVLSDGTAERSGAKVEQKLMSQWFFKITDYAERLLQDLDALDWPESTKQMQRNWIGKSEGAEVDFEVEGTEQKITVFTTRIDTLFSGTYLILAPDNNLVQGLTTADFKNEVEKYIQATKQKSVLERTDLNKDKTAAFTGSYAINPATGQRMPIWISDFVLNNYGTGAVFADAHDERDFELAKKYNIPLKESLDYSIVYPLEKDLPVVKRNVVKAIVKHWTQDKYLVITEKKFDDIKVFVGGGVDDNETLEQAIKREIGEESGYCDFKIFKNVNLRVHNKFYNKKKGQNQYSVLNAFYIELDSDKQLVISEEEKQVTSYEWVDKDQLLEKINSAHEKYLVSRVIFDKPFTGYGILYNSGQFDGLTSEEAKPAITKWGAEQGWARPKTTYRLRDWSIGRQRYWGCPIPVYYDENGKENLISESDLPLLLPKDLDLSTGMIKPLSQNQEFVNSASAKYGDGAKYEPDTMDTFVDSSWYFFRYCSPHNNEVFADVDEIKKWMPVDQYIIGAEHSTLHLLYARFFTKVLFDEGLIDFQEPFIKMRHQGMILGGDNQKMSKSKGNVVNPIEVFDEYGADTLRMYEMFMGPFDQPKPWNTNSIKGVRRFLDRVWDLQSKIVQNPETAWGPKKEMTVEVALNKLIKKVSEDIESFSFNTCVSEFMKFINLVEETGGLLAGQYHRFLIVLAPFAPFITEELYQNLELKNKKSSVHLEQFPIFDPKLLVESSAKIVVQINGKVRTTFEIETDSSEEAVVEQANQAASKWLKGKKITFTKVVPNRLINFVVE